MDTMIYTSLAVMIVLPSLTLALGIAIGAFWMLSRRERAAFDADTTLVIEGEYARLGRALADDTQQMPAIAVEPERPAGGWQFVVRTASGAWASVREYLAAQLPDRSPTWMPGQLLALADRTPCTECGGRHCSGCDTTAERPDDYTPRHPASQLIHWAGTYAERLPTIARNVAPMPGRTA